MRSDSYALHHARQAAIIFGSGILLVALYTVGTIVLSVVTLGFGSFLSLCCIPLLFLPWVPTIHGLVLAFNDRWDEPLGLFGLGTKLLGGITVQEKPPGSP
jgi:hypothetical protein